MALDWKRSVLQLRPTSTEGIGRWFLRWSRWRSASATVHSRIQFDFGAHRAPRFPISPVGQVDHGLQNDVRVWRVHKALKGLNLPRCSSLKRSLTQVDLAERLDVHQASVAALEHHVDPQLSSLRRYIRAMSGELEMRAVFPDATFRLETPKTKHG